MANVKVIPATIQKHSKMPINENQKRRVAAYARVSTNHEEQQTSYEAQVDYYTNHIRKNPDWEFAGVYTDEGISALNTRSRTGFNTMIEDALDGKIDLILTKSVSRFARNTVDSLSTIRLLKEKGVEVYFEKENIWTFDGKGELLLTIMSSLAQEESRSISENITWGHRKRFADGKLMIPFKSFLGYKRGEDGQPEIVPEEAEIVRKIYRMYINGQSTNAIAKELTNLGIKSPKGRDLWRPQTIMSILTNEKYKGDAILQKKFTVDFLNKKMKLNEGELPQYYVTDSHPGIIDKTEWNLVQAEIEYRKTKGRHYNSLTPFSSKIICGDCGSYYGSKVWHSTDKYRTVIWQCNGKFRNEKKCTTLHLREEQIKEFFMKAVNELLGDREHLLEDCRYLYDVLLNTEGIDKTCRMLMEDMGIVATLTEKLIDDNAKQPMDQEEYDRKYAKLEKRYTDDSNKLQELENLKSDRLHDAASMEMFIAQIETSPEFPVEYSDVYWNAMIDHATVYADDRIVFTFRNGQTVEEEI